MASIYRTLLREIEGDDFQVLHQRVRPDAAAQAVARLARTGASADPHRRAARGHRRRLGRPGRAVQGAPGRLPSPCSRWRRSSAGARAASTSPRAVALDNGQHILIGAYTRDACADAPGRRRPASDCCERMPLALDLPRRAGLRLPAGAPVPAFVARHPAAHPAGPGATPALLARAALSLVAWADFAATLHSAWPTCSRGCRRACATT